MSRFAAVVLTIIPGVAGFILLTWLSGRRDKRRRTKSALAAEKYLKRLGSPDFEGMERHLGHRLPESFYALYGDTDLVRSEDLLIAVPNPLERSEDSYIAFFQPADRETLDDPWPGCEGLFPFANNGAGDQFLVNLGQPDPEVVYYLHETGEKGSLGVPLSAFIAAPRRPVPDD